MRVKGKKEGIGGGREKWDGGKERDRENKGNRNLFNI